MDTREYILLGILDHLFVKADRPSTIRGLAERLAVSPLDIGEALLHLEDRSLIDATAIRLTLSGLAAASTLSAARRQQAA